MKEDKENCIFCKILEGNSPVSMVYEDELVAVFPPLEPVNPGHLLVIPKIHAPYLNDLNTKCFLHVMKIAKMMAAAIRESTFRSEGINFFLADGESAMQEVFHFHMHIIPRYKGDGFGLKHGPNNFVKVSRKELDEIAMKIRKQLKTIS